MTGRQVPAVEPGSPEWLRYMSASKIAAVLGISPWESPYSLWCQMAGLLERQPQTQEQSRGHYLERSLAAWLADQHPDKQLVDGGCWVNVDRPWQMAAPDGRLLHADGQTVELAEYKTDADGTGWGRPGSDEIPLYYRAQTMWQMDTYGATRTRLAVLTGRLEFREYVVDYDPDDAALMRTAGEEFMNSLLWQEMPDLDPHPATYEAVKHLHPDIDDLDADIDTSIAVEFLRALEGKTTADKREQQARTSLAAALGTAKRARWNGHTLATRQAKKGGTPYLVAGRNLPPAPPADTATLHHELTGAAA